jgi:hypothetical protein
MPFRGQDRFEESAGGTRVTVEIEWDSRWGGVGRIIERLTRPLFHRRFQANARQAARLLAEGG